MGKEVKSEKRMMEDYERRELARGPCVLEGEACSLPPLNV